MLFSNCHLQGIPPHIILKVFFICPFFISSPVLPYEDHHNLSYLLPFFPELFYTERAHVRKLKVLDRLFYQRVSREGILTAPDLRKIFSNLEDILQLHSE